MTKQWMQLALFLGLAAAGAATSAAQEKHVKDILADQPRELISASKLCQRAWSSPAYGYDIVRRVNPATLEPDLEHLMADSDEVIVASSSSNFTSAISPSGTDAYRYYDVRVIRALKGTHKVGDVITFAVPYAMLSCWGNANSPHGGVATFDTRTDGWRSGVYGPFILFLRRTTSDQTRFIPGYRLTGAEGAQGLFGVPHDSTAREWDRCDESSSLKALRNCNSFLESSQSPIMAGFDDKLLSEKFDNMSVSDFLNLLQNMADKTGRNSEVESLK